MKSLIKKITIACMTVLTAFIVAGCGNAQTDTSVTDIIARGSFRVAIPDYDTSLLYYDTEAGAFRGTEAEIIDVIASSLGVPVQYVEVPKAELMLAVANGNADVAIGYIDQNSSSLQNYGKTLSYGGENLYVVSPRGVYVGSLTVFKDNKVGVSNLIDQNAYGPVYNCGAAEVLIYDNSQSVIAALSNDEIEGYVCYQSEAQYLISTGDFQVQSCVDLEREEFVIGTLASNTELISGSNNLIKMYLEGKKAASWMPQPEVAEEQAAPAQ
ncbi:MAG: transporter substrate-binding domain-containing protein [Lachnospiraceae bacterium]|nr:transporter substrate-binding domain-containing protein [Lachnospiraceae bacterium]